MCSNFVFYKRGNSNDSEDEAYRHVLSILLKYYLIKRECIKIRVRLAVDYTL